MTDVSENVNETRTADLRVRPATIEDRPAVERLWLMFRHDMSEYQGGLPAADGTFRSERLESAFTGDGWAPYLLTLGDHLVGFAFVRGLDGPVRVLNSFFVVRGARRGEWDSGPYRRCCGGIRGGGRWPFSGTTRAGRPSGTGSRRRSRRVCGAVPSGPYRGGRRCPPICG